MAIPCDGTVTKTELLSNGQTVEFFASACLVNGTWRLEASPIGFGVKPLWDLLWKHCALALCRTGAVN